MPKNKCEECWHEYKCVNYGFSCMRPLNLSQQVNRIKFIPKTYISEKEWINQWEEKDEKIL